MREDELVTEIRAAAQLPDDFADYTAARIRTEATNVLQNQIAPTLFAARCGIGLKRWPITLTSGKSTYALPPRAIAAGFECLDLSDGTSYWPLTEVSAEQAWAYETSTNDRPRFYCVLATGVRLYPTPNQAYTLRTQFYGRPSMIVEKQASDTVGIIDAVDYDLRQLTLASNVVAVLDKMVSGSLPLVSQRPIDVVSLDDTSYGAYATVGTTYDCSLFHAQWSLGAATRIDVAAGFDISEVKVGDAVRCANQSEWPMLPHEHHSLLVAATAAKICRDRGMYQAASAQQEIFEAGMPTLQKSIQPRVKSSAQALVPRASLLRRRMMF